MTEKIKLAFIKFGGLATGGTEKFFQTLAMNLPKDRFDVTYFYCDAAPYVGSEWKHPDTDPNRLALMQTSAVKLVKFRVAAKNVTVPTHDWLETDFWECFDETKFDVVVTARAGHPEYPFTKIRSIPIVDTLHMPGMVDNQDNIAAVVHVSEWNKQLWLKNGGKPAVAHVIYPPIQLPESVQGDLREELSLQGKFVFGLHQRANDGIYSHIPLAAYSQIQDENTAFVILGGSKKYSQQAELLDLQNFHQLPETGDIHKVCQFLKTLDIYAHGRADGENNSQAIAEAMSFGKPIVSHFARANGHVETISNAGLVVQSIEDYAVQMKNLRLDSNYYNDKSTNGLRRFKEQYDFATNIQKFATLIEKAYTENKSVVADDEWLNDWLDEDED